MTVADLHPCVVSNHKARRLVVHLDRHALEVEELVAHDVRRPASDGLNADTHPGVRNPIAPHTNIGLVVVDLDAVIDTERDIISKDVVAVGRAGTWLNRDTVGEVPDGVVADHVAGSAQIDPPFSRYTCLGPCRSSGNRVVAHRLSRLRCVGTPVVHTKIDVTDGVASDEDVLRVLRVDPPAPVLDDKPVDDDVRRVSVVPSNGDHSPVRVGPLDGHNTVCDEGDRAPQRPRLRHLERLVGTGTDRERVSGEGTVSGALETAKGIRLFSGATTASGNHVQTSP